MNRTPRLAAVAVGALLLTACTSLAQGPAGRVVDKDSHTYKIGKTFYTDYYLTTQAEDGTRTEFEVSSEHYDRCYTGSSYPGCLRRTDRD